MRRLIFIDKLRAAVLKPLDAGCELVVLVLFGAKKLPEIGGGLGRAIRNFRKAQEEPDEIDISAKKSEAPQQEAPRSVASEQASQEVKSETKQTV